MQIQGTMPFPTFKNIINVNKPFDKGYMFVFGNKYNITNDYMKTSYDIDTVPYIVFQEEGTKFFDGNEGFIRDNTITELNQVAVYEAHGITQERVAYRDTARAKTSMISQGTMTHVKSYGKQGGSYRAYVGQ